MNVPSTIVRDSTTDPTGRGTNVVEVPLPQSRYVAGLRVRPFGTNVATVLRVWGGAPNAKNMLLYELTLPPTTSAKGGPDEWILLGLRFPLDHKLLVALTVPVAGHYEITAADGAAVQTTSKAAR